MTTAEMINAFGDRTLSILLIAVILGAGTGSLEVQAQQSPAPGCAAPPASPLAVNVKDKGAKGDGRTDDTAAIQAVIDDVAGKGGSVQVPNGTYMVNAARKKSLVLKSNMTLKMAAGATLKAIPNNLETYAVLYLAGASNVTLDGGTLEGDRREHLGKTGEWGMGLHIAGGAAHITISGVTAKNMWGDGFYVQGATDVTFCSVTADHNRRQGLSIIEVDGLVVTNSMFKNTKGTRPSAGIDLEPNTPAQKINNVRIESSKFIDNAGAGILIAGKKAPISNVEITHNVFEGTLPVVVEDAPDVLDQSICRNRQITYQQEPAGALAAHAGPVRVVLVQSECGDRRMVVRRQKSKKSN